MVRSELSLLKSAAFLLLRIGQSPYFMTLEFDSGERYVWGASPFGAFHSRRMHSPLKAISLFCSARALASFFPAVSTPGRIPACCENVSFPDVFGRYRAFPLQFPRGRGSGEKQRIFLFHAAEDSPPQLKELALPRFFAPRRGARTPLREASFFFFFLGPELLPQRCCGQSDRLSELRPPTTSDAQELQTLSALSICTFFPFVANRLSNDGVFFAI